MIVHTFRDDSNLEILKKIQGIDIEGRYVYLQPWESDYYESDYYESEIASLYISFNVSFFSPIFGSVSINFFISSSEFVIS
jgi:hypothetical protein